MANRGAQVDISLAAITLVKANVMAYVVTAIFILFSSIILTYTDVTPKFEQVITLLGIMVSAFFVGFDTAKIENRNGYKWGAVGGALYFVIFLILGTIMGQLNCVSPGAICLLGIMILVVSSIAGMISVNSESRNKYKR